MKQIRETPLQKFQKWKGFKNNSTTDAKPQHGEIQLKPSNTNSSHRILENELEIDILYGKVKTETKITKTSPTKKNSKESKPKTENPDPSIYAGKKNTPTRIRTENSQDNHQEISNSFQRTQQIVGPIFKILLEIETEKEKEFFSRAKASEMKPNNTNLYNPLSFTLSFSL